MCHLDCLICAHNLALTVSYVPQNLTWTVIYVPQRKTGKYRDDVEGGDAAAEVREERRSHQEVRHLLAEHLTAKKTSTPNIKKIMDISG